MAQEIKFGTDGWRGIIADDFTFDNVRRVAGAIASYVLKYEDAQRGFFVGYDTRFASQRAAQVAAEVIAAAGIPVKLANDYTPTPGRFLCRETSGCGGRSDGYLQPQSVELEWSEVQGKIRRLGHARHHEEGGGRTARRRDAAR